MTCEHCAIRPAETVNPITWDHLCRLCYWDDEDDRGTTSWDPAWWMVGAVVGVGSLLVALYGR